MDADNSAFDNGDVVTQVEDNDPESLAGDAVTFDPDDDDRGQQSDGA